MIRRELIVFLFVGCTAVAIDYMIYRTLLWSVVPYSNAAKAIAFVGGALFAFAANRSWTFGHFSNIRVSLLRFVIVYAVTLGANVAINALVLQYFGTMAYAYNIAFLVATGTSAVLNFVGMKFYVFQSGQAKISL